MKQAINFKREILDSGITLRQQKFLNQIAESDLTVKRLINRLGDSLNNKTIASYLVKYVIGRKNIIQVLDKKGVKIENI
tara:strand:- start:1457 stop:1693 length:237 start_codon:yes stop_codon:yes gene_type:complete